MAEGNMLLNSTTLERNDPKDRNVRRNSTGRTSTSDSGKKVLPHYLRASTNSCHEFCKYGREHTFAEVGKNTFSKGVAEKMVENEKPEKNLIMVDKKNKSQFKPKISPDRKVKELDTLKTIKIETTSLKKVDVSAKPSTGLKLKPVAVKSSSSPLSPSGITGRRNSDLKALNMSGSPKTGQKKALLLPRSSLSPKPFARTSLSAKNKAPKAASSPRKIQKKVTKDESVVPNQEKVSEKTLYVIEPKLDTGSFELDLSSPSSSNSSLPLASPTFSSPEGELEEDHHGAEGQEESVDFNYKMDVENETRSGGDVTENQNLIATSNPDYKKVSRKTVHEDLELAQKLNFRRGRELENNRSSESDSRRQFTRKEVNDISDTNTSLPEPENVVLRHQDVQGKKETQGLLNNVIEETASKLVEKRKSKVKALVGAFETVISLQESKPSTTSANLSS